MQYLHNALRFAHAGAGESLDDERRRRIVAAAKEASRWSAASRLDPERIDVMSLILATLRGTGSAPRAFAH